MKSTMVLLLSPRMNFRETISRMISLSEGGIIQQLCEVDEGEKRLHEKKRGGRIIKKSRWGIDGVSSSQHNQHVATKGAISGASHMPI